MKTILYTCITANRDSVPPLPFFNQYLDYVVFIDPAELDPALDIRPWAARELLWKHPDDPVRTSRWHKHNPMKCFPQYTSSIWMDATHWPTTDISWFPAWFLQRANIACFPHFWRTTVASEAAEVINLKLDDETTVRDQMARYQEAGFTGEADSQLFDGSIIVRRHCPKIKRLSELWWGEIEKGSRRDQLSLTYCLWKLGMRCEPIVPGHSRHPTHAFKKKGSPYFDWKSHPYKGWVKP